MTQEEVLYHWNYFRSLCERLEATRSYVDHGTIQIQNNNGNTTATNHSVFSNEFQQILILACVEFEGVGKIISQSIDPNFNMKWGSINDITKTVLTKYPKLVETEIFTDYRESWKPLADWKIGQRSNPDNPARMQSYVEGLSWWDDYSDLKHQGYSVFYKATLDNVIASLAALNVLELYLVKIELGTTKIATSYRSPYFGSEYISHMICDDEGQLPDFGNTSSSAVLSPENH